MTTPARTNNGRLEHRNENPPPLPPPRVLLLSSSCSVCRPSLSSSSSFRAQHMGRARKIFSASAVRAVLRPDYSLTRENGGGGGGNTPGKDADASTGASTGAGGDGGGGREGLVEPEHGFLPSAYHRHPSERSLIESQY